MSENVEIFNHILQVLQNIYRETKSSNSSEIIAIFSGLLCTVTGAILGYIANVVAQRGKLSFFVSDWHAAPMVLNANGNRKATSEWENAKCYESSFSIDLYNSSGNYKILREPTFLFQKGKEMLKSFKIEQLTINGMLISAKIEPPLTVSPKTAIKIKSTIEVFEDFKPLKGLDAIYFTYKDEKDKVQKVLISTEDSTIRDTYE